MNQRAFDKHFDKMIGGLNDRMAHEQAWIEERNSEKLTGRQAVAAAEISVAWQAIADALDRGRAPGDLLTQLRDALWDREQLAKPKAHVPGSEKKKSAAQLDADIAEALVKTSIEKRTGQDREIAETVTARPERAKLVRIVMRSTTSRVPFREGTIEASLEDQEDFSTLVRTKGHDTREAALTAILRLADRRGFKVTNRELFEAKLGRSAR